MNYAIIEGDVCVNIIVADENFAKQIGAVILPDGYGRGDLYCKGAWAKKPESAPHKFTSEEMRETAYKTMAEKEDSTPLIPWRGEALTVDQANDLWIKYAAEGDGKIADTMQALISRAKEYIRAMYPDEERDNGD